MLRPVHCILAFGLEVQLSAELHGSRNMSACCLPEGAVFEPSVDAAEVSVVEDIEGLGPQLKVEPLRELDVFHQSEIDPFDARAQEASNSTTPKVSLCGTE